MDDELIARIEKWRNSTLAAGGTDFITGGLQDAVDVIMNGLTVLTILATSGTLLSEAMKAAFVMGVSWQRFLSTEGSDLEDLLKGINLD